MRKQVLVKDKQQPASSRLSSILIIMRHIREFRKIHLCYTVQGVRCPLGILE